MSFTLAVKDFCDALREQPGAMIDQIDALERFYMRMHSLSAVLPMWIDRCDQMQSIMRRERLSFKERLLALADAQDRWAAADLQHCSPRVRQFLDALRQQPKVAEAIVQDPEMAKHFASIEYAMQRAYELGDADTTWQARFDEMLVIVGRTDLSLKQRLIAVGEAFQRYQVDLHGRLN
jgi:hypothetical protein